jgi:hypothetical protein
MYELVLLELVKKKGKKYCDHLRASSSGDYIYETVRLYQI